MTTDLAPFAGTVGGGFFIGFITAYAIKKVIKLAAVIVGLFIVALAYLEYQRILNVDWHKIQSISQNEIDWVVDAITHVSTTMDGSHPGTLSNIGIPLVSSVSAGFALGLAIVGHPMCLVNHRSLPLLTWTNCLLCVVVKAN